MQFSLFYLSYTRGMSKCFVFLNNVQHFGKNYIVSYIYIRQISIHHIRPFTIWKNEKKLIHFLINFCLLEKLKEWAHKKFPVNFKNNQAAVMGI